MLQQAFIVCFVMILLGLPSWAQNSSISSKSFFELSANSIDGQKVHFSKYRGQVLLIVNTASKCGFTPQLKDLEELYKKYSTKGFSVLAFPSNDFKQDPAEDTEILSFSKKEYGTTFPFFEKASITGANKQPVYQFLVNEKPGVLFKEVSWNFEKFLIGRDGKVLERWSSLTKPSSQEVITAIEKALNVPL